MMYFDEKPAQVFARVWNITPADKYTDLRVSTSEKRQDGTYANSNWFFRCIGHAHNKAKELHENDYIKVTKLKLTNEQYEKDGQKRSALRVLVFEFEIANRNGQQPSKKQSNKSTPAPEPQTETQEDDPEDMPF